MYPIAFWRIETVSPPLLHVCCHSRHSGPECVSDIFLRDLRSWMGEGGGIEEHFLGCSGPWAPKMFKQEGGEVVFGLMLERASERGWMGEVLRSETQKGSLLGNARI